MANRRFESQFLFSFHAMQVQLDCSFTVAPADTAGNGVTGQVGGGIKKVFMHTSATPATGSPNPAVGYIYVQLHDPFYNLYSHEVGFQSPVTGSGIAINGASSLTLGVPYVILTLGTTTAAEWLAVGVPAGVTPAVGVTFFAKATSAGGAHTGTVKAVGISGISSVELCGTPALSPANPVQNGGGILIFQCLAPTSSSVTTAVPTAPAVGTIIRLKLVVSNSSILIKGW